MDVKKVLTGFPPRAPAASELGQALADAGLELWQAPEGFWAIRVKPRTASTKPARQRRARRAA